MSRSLRSLAAAKWRLTAAAAIGVVLAASPTAIAFFASPGAGAATGSAGSLSAPANPSASTSGATVTVGWDASLLSDNVTPAGSYTVERYDSGATTDLGPACGGSTIPSSSGVPNASGHFSCADTPGVGTFTYRITATYRSWTASAFTSTVTVVQPPDHFLVSAPGTATAGTLFSVTVTAQDSSNQTVTSYTGAHTIVWTGASTAPDGTAPSYQASVTFASGVGTAATTLYDAETTTLTATAGTVSGTSGSIVVGDAGADTYNVANPGTRTAGTAFSVTITALDAYLNTALSYSGSHPVVYSDPHRAPDNTAPTYPGFTTFTAGIATPSMTLVDAETTTLTAHHGFVSGTSTAFTVTAGAATQLAFTTSPGNTSADNALSPQPAVTVQDQYLNIVTADSSSVTLAIKSGTPTAGGPGSLTGCSQTETSGVVTFSGCKIITVGTAYQLHATDGPLTAADSSTFNITPGAATKLVFATSPGSMSADNALSPQPQVTVQDQYANTVTSDSSTVTLAIKSGTPTAGGPGSVTGCSQSETSGVVTFSGCKIITVGTAYQLHATDASLTAADSTAFNITPGAATKLAFTTSPGNTSADNPLSGQPVVTVQDQFGNTVTSDPSSVTLAIKSGTPTSGGPGSLGSCAANPKAAVSGVATFSGCKITTVGTAYQLHATDGALTAADSTAFNITPGAATKLATTTSPGNSTGGTAFATQPVVTVEDAGGNTVTTDTSSVTLAITGGTGTAGATLTCTANPKAAVAGVATFAGCKIDRAGSGYTLTATDGSLTSAVSGSFNITVGAATKLGMTTSPSNSTGGTVFATQPVVTVQDAGGNTVTTDTSSVTLAITGGTGTAGATLTCTANPKAAVAGVATFAGCKIDRAGSGYTLTATDGSLTSAVSSSFNITVGAAAKLTVTTSPSNSTGGTVFATQPVVTVQDAGGNTVTTDTSSVTLAITGGTGTAGATLTCTANPKAAVAGVATFAGCKIDRAGSGYTLTATDGSLTSAVSSSFNITVGAAAKLTVTTSPSNSTGGTVFATQPVVTVQDAGGNTVTTDTSSVTLAITGGTGTAGATLTCTANPKAAVAGVATFAGCKIDRAGSGYTLTATDGSLTSAVSGSFNITVGAAAQLVLAAATTTPTAGAADNLTITAADAGGNTVTTYTGSKSLTFGGASIAPTGTTHPTVSNGSGTAINFGSVTAITFTSGVATVSGSNNGIMKLYKAETVSITVSDGSLTNGTGLSVTVSPAAATVMRLAACAITGVSSPCTSPFSLGNGGTLTASVDIFDAYSNVPTAIAVSITATSASPATYPVTGSPVSITGTGSPVNRSSQFTVTKIGNANNSTTITLHVTTAGLSFPDVVFTVQK